MVGLAQEATTPGARTVATLSDGSVHTVDAVVFACCADAAAGLLPRRAWFAAWLLRRIGYVDDDNAAFERGVIHSDGGVIPAEHRHEVLSGFANYIEVSGTGASAHVENTFVISSWLPSARRAGRWLDFLVTYALRPGSGKTIAAPVGEVTNWRAHPHMSLRNLLLSVLLRFVQGRQRLYFAGSYATPGNGHDLSLLSGLLVTRALGVPYPFPDDVEAHRDFQALARLMGLPA